MLFIWSASDSCLLSKTFASSLRSFRPDVPPHQFLSFVEGAPPPEVAIGDVVLVCGNKPLDVLRAAGLAPKNRTVTSIREKPIASLKGGCFMVTFDPGITLTEFDKKEVMDWDLRLAVRLMRTNSLKPVVGDYRWVNTLQPFIDRVMEKWAATGKPVDVSMDTETMGLSPYEPNKDFVSISFTVDAGRSDMLYLRADKAPVALDPTIPLFDQIVWLLKSPKVRLRMANGKYDLVWIAEKWGIECLNFKFDSLLVGSLLDENRSNSLNLHAKIFTPIGGYDDAFNAKFNKATMEAVPHEDLRVYQGGDTDACQQVSDILRDELAEDHELTRFYITILHPAARAFERLERRGVLVDQQKMAVLGDDLRKVIKESQNLQMELLPKKMRIKFMDRIEEQLAGGKNPMLPSIVKEYFFTPHGLNLKPKETTDRAAVAGQVASEAVRRQPRGQGHGRGDDRRRLGVQDALDLRGGLPQTPAARWPVPSELHAVQGRVQRRRLGRPERNEHRTALGQGPGIPDDAQEDEVGQAHPRVLSGPQGQESHFD
jgi:3'-5' exonuclease